MSKPPIYPEQSAAGIAVDPRTLERVIPESRRPDGSVRKQIKIRPGFTPQEDVSRFRGTKQQQMDRNALPKGHILGWIAPSSETRAKAGAGGGSSSMAGSGAGAGSGSGTDKPLTKSAAKNAKRKAKKLAEKEKIIKDNWDDDGDDDDEGEQEKTTTAATSAKGTSSEGLKVKGAAAEKTSDPTKTASSDAHVKDATEGLDKLQIH